MWCAYRTGITGIRGIVGTRYQYITGRDNMEDLITTVQTILSICGGISIIGGAAAILTGAYKKYKKPTNDLENRITVIESDIKDIKQKLNNDYESINNNRNDMNLLMRSMFCLIENKITGNNIEGLKKTRDELINALTEK
jgi:hypothetical protein